ncbi:MAG: M15 family metallopeptidase [Treponema sp.]|nr:M15 family metallopeptidase [Treponema sp.]
MPANAILPVPPELQVMRRSYPDVVFSATYDFFQLDWRIDVTAPIWYGKRGKQNKKSATFYWADGAMLPKDELPNRAKYWTLLYHYPEDLRDPATLSEMEIDMMREFSSKDNRQNSSGTPMFFFEFLYAAKSRVIIEDHIKSILLWNKKTKVHERILPALRRVESRVNELAKTDTEVSAFVTTLRSADAYYWRRIADTKRLSFHSLGIAVDVLPKSWRGKQIYWLWARNYYGADWMLTPLEKRWMPPASVIAIFEDEGFIWGGKWGIFDNMHFEYHPELFAVRKMRVLGARP